MPENSQSEFTRRSFINIKPTAISLSSQELTKTVVVEPGEGLPLIVQANMAGLDLAEWARASRAYIEMQLLKCGAILFRDFKVDSLSKFQKFVRSISPQLLEYRERSTPRTEVSEEIYTATEYPADQCITLHNESSYSTNWPMKIWFYCEQPAATGGETPLANSRKIFERLDSEIKERFIQKKVMYVRNYSEGIDLPWQTVFQTTDRLAVEDYCREFDIDFEWQDGTHLRTRQIRPAVATHPRTGETVWFNQAHLFHVSSLALPLRESLLSLVDERDLSRNSYYGDGSAIETSVLDEIRNIYRQSAVIFPWQQGDVLMLDNMLAAHGRMAFSGSRRVLAAMAESYSARSIQQTPEGQNV
jgi:alpha-ketoglutarate-dependent taurine dioxygenase